MIYSSQAKAAYTGALDATQGADGDVDVLARTLWGEARGEGQEGMIAVANVIVNRASRPGWWGRSVREVCLKPWQFSCWSASDPNLPRMLAVDASDTSFAAALEIAAAAVSGSLDDITGGATNYHAVGIMPAWADSMTVTGQIGRHIFYA